MESLTDDELRLLGESLKRSGSSSWESPDCGGEPISGLAGGAATNFSCGHCHSEFNLTVFGDLVIGERISDRGPRDVGNRAWCYGLKA